MLTRLARLAIRRLAPLALRRPPSAGASFRGRERTLFVYDAPSDRWLVVAWDGSEVSIPAGDLDEFLLDRLHGGGPRKGREGED